MNLRLDCETIETTLCSLCNAFSCSEKKLIEALLSLDLEKTYSENWENIELPSDEYLFRHISDILGTPKSFNTICWFHGTRTTEGNLFQKGILPLGEILPEIWDILCNLAENKETKERLKKMQLDGFSNFHFEYKSTDPFHWGPYGILVKDVAKYATKLGQHDYLAMPEIIEDICNGYEKKYGESIIEIYQEKLKPCIIKFTTQADNNCINEIIAALSYAYTDIRRKKVSMNAVTCFDGHNSTIPAQNIISVEYIMQ